MSLGDNNNPLFHQQCRVNWNQNKILALKNNGNVLVHGQGNCAKVAVDYFETLLGSHCLHNPIDLSMVDCKILNKKQSRLLEAPITNLVIFDTIRHMIKNKAPRLDGVNAEFFLTTWHITGASFCEAVRHFFSTSSLHPGTNSTFIALIPKSVSPTCKKDFRPISLCTVMYKCISKIIASRLKKIMPSLVDSSQSTFIPGRSISDNILLAQKLFRGYDRQTGTPNCAFKIDLHKAFDSLKWDFILAVLVKMQFPSSMVSWIESCLCTTRFYVKLNGIIHGYFPGTKGLRQGDPMSPYIFALCMNILSSILNNTPHDFAFIGVARIEDQSSIFC